MTNFLKTWTIFILVMLLSTIAYAVGDSENAGSHDVYATYEAEEEKIVYNVKIEWGSMEFTYKETPGTWNPATKQYENASEGWIYTSENGENTNKITVTNNSNAKINAKFNFESEKNVNITGGFFESSDENGNFVEQIMLDSAADSNNTSEEVYFMITEGEFKGSEKTKIGSITIEIENCDEVAVNEQRDVPTIALYLEGADTVSGSFNEVSSGNYMYNYTSDSDARAVIEIKIKGVKYFICENSTNGIYLSSDSKAYYEMQLKANTMYTFDLTVDEYGVYSIAIA